MLRIWKRAHDRYAFLRWPAKALLFAAAAFLVLFPDPGRARTLMARVQDMEQLLDPEHPALAPLEQQARASLSNTADGRSALRVVEKVVYEHVPYSFDWQTWGVVEWLSLKKSSRRPDRCWRQRAIWPGGMSLSPLAGRVKQSIRFVI